MNANKGFMMPVVIIIIAFLILGSGVFFYNKRAATSVVKNKTVGWLDYKSEQGFEFSYPPYFSLDQSSTADTVIFTYNSPEMNYFSVDSKDSTQSLEQDVQETVAAIKIGSAQAATLVTVNYKPYVIGMIRGYLITSTAADALQNTDAIFVIKNDTKIVSFKYSYQGYILSKNSTELKVYNDIQTTISTFKFIP